MSIRHTAINVPWQLHEAPWTPDNPHPWPSAHPWNISGAQPTHIPHSPYKSTRPSNLLLHVQKYPHEIGCFWKVPLTRISIFLRLSVQHQSPKWHSHWYVSGQGRDKKLVSKIEISDSKVNNGLWPTVTLFLAEWHECLCNFTWYAKDQDLSNSIPLGHMRTKYFFPLRLMT